MHARSTTARLYRAGVGVVGSLVVVLGVILIPLPGPGWLIVFIGLSILASEFAWAERLLHFARAKVGSWTGWVAARSRAGRLLVGASGLALLAGFALAVAFWSGVVPIERTSASGAP